MDPSIQVGRISASKKDRSFSLSSYSSYSGGKIPEISPRYQSDRTISYPQKLSQARLKLSDLTREQFWSLGKLVDPFQALSKSIFTSKEAVTLANLDGVFDLTGVPKGDLSSTVTYLSDRYLYLTLGDSTEGLAEYLQYRLKLTIGYGMYNQRRTGEVIPTQVQTEGLNTYQLEWGEEEDGGDGTGNLITNSEALVEKMRRYHENNFNLILGWGYLSLDPDLKSNLDPNRLLINQAITLSLLKEGGDFVLRIPNLFDSVTQELIYLISGGFERIYLIKPITTPQDRTTCFLVGKGKKKDFSKLISHLKVLKNGYSKGAFLKKVVTPPSSFRSYLKSIMDYLYQLVQQKLEKMDQARTEWKRRPTEYLLSRIYQGWDIPTRG